MRPKQLPMMDGNTDKLAEIESENNKEEQQTHKRETRRTDESVSVTQFGDKTAMESERIDTVGRYTAEKLETVSVKEISTCLVDGENKKSEITERVTQSMDAENSEIQMTEKPRNFDEDKTNDEAYLFQNYIKRRSSLPIPCASKQFYSKQNVIATKNSTRTARRAEMPALQERSKVIALQRSKVDGTLKENIASIQQHLNTSKDKTKRAELMGAVEVAKKFKKIYFSR